MANWQKLAKALVLADGIVSEKETEILRKEFLADGVINKTEAEFLIDVRNTAPQAVALLSASPSLVARAAEVQMEPCWAVMASFAAARKRRTLRRISGAGHGCSSWDRPVLRGPAGR